MTRITFNTPPNTEMEEISFDIAHIDVARCLFPNTDWLLIMEESGCVLVLVEHRFVYFTQLHEGYAGYFPSSL